MSPSSTVSDFRGARDEVKTNFEQVKLTAQNVKNAKVAELETAYQDLDSTIQNIPETATLQTGYGFCFWAGGCRGSSSRSDGCRFELPLRMAVQSCRIAVPAVLG